MMRCNAGDVFVWLVIEKFSFLNCAIGKIHQASALCKIQDIYRSF
jgi:hypothetical protein